MDVCERACLAPHCAIIIAKIVAFDVRCDRYPPHAGPGVSKQLYNAGSQGEKRIHK